MPCCVLSLHRGAETLHAISGGIGICGGEYEHVAFKTTMSPGNMGSWGWAIFEDHVNFLTNENFSNFSLMLLLFFLCISIADLDVSLIANNFCVFINSINPR